MLASHRSSGVAAASSSSSAPPARTAPRRLAAFATSSSSPARSRPGAGIHRRVLPGGTVAPCGRVDAPASGRDLGRDARGALAGPEDRRRARAARRDAERDARAVSENALEREREFVADAGHELRTPLALLRTELELALRHAETPEELRDAMRASSEEVDRLAQLAEDLLLIASSDRGKLPLRLETLETAELLDSIANRFEWRAQEAVGAVPVVTPGASGARRPAPDSSRRSGNLLDNALRYGTGEVRLSARANGRCRRAARDRRGQRLPARADGAGIRAFRAARSGAGARRLRARALDRSRHRGGTRGQRAPREHERERRGRLGQPSERRDDRRRSSTDYVTTRSARCTRGGPRGGQRSTPANARAAGRTRRRVLPGARRCGSRTPAPGRRARRSSRTNHAFAASSPWATTSSSRRSVGLA